mmetsp:Transcript_16510/g.14414  ORF Transcript_16510/g.14414 Transcript_16510/m.14414 type:complete len:124 (+) Transcript_16510:214-585(+)
MIRNKDNSFDLAAIQKNFKFLTRLCQEAKKENHLLSEMNRHLKHENHNFKIENESLKAKVSLLGEASKELAIERNINKELAEKNSLNKLQIETLQRQYEKKANDCMDMETQLEYQRTDSENMK